MWLISIFNKSPKDRDCVVGPLPNGRTSWQPGCRIGMSWKKPTQNHALEKVSPLKYQSFLVSTLNFRGVYIYMICIYIETL